MSLTSLQNNFQQTPLYRNFLKPYFLPFATHRYTVVTAGVLCAIPAIEMAMRAYEDIQELWNTPIPAEDHPKQDEILQRRNRLKECLPTHALGGVALGACAANLFPGSGVIGCLGFTLFSRSYLRKRIQKEDPHILVTATFTGMAVEVASIGAKAARRIAFHYLKKGFIFGIKHPLKVVKPIGKSLAGVGKVALTAFRHPYVVLGVVVLAGAIRYHHITAKILQGAAKVISRLVQGLLLTLPYVFRGIIQVVKAIPGAVQGIIKAISRLIQGLFSALPYLLRGIQHLGKALYYVPALLIELIKKIAAVLYALTHPVQTFRTAFRIY